MFAFSGFLFLPFHGFVLLVLFHNNLTLCCAAHRYEDTVSGSLNMACGRGGNELTVEGVEADGSALAYCAHGAAAHGEGGLGGVGGVEVMPSTMSSSV